MSIFFNFFPRRKLTSIELSIIPEAIFQLLIAMLKVSFLHPKLWMPDSTHGIRLKTQGTPKTDYPTFRFERYSRKTENEKRKKNNPEAEILNFEHGSLKPLDYRSIANVINGLSTRTLWPSTCLVKVLAAHKMLAKRKILHTLHFGVNKNLSEGFKAHAWLSVGTDIILGGENVGEYKEIQIFKCSIDQ